MNRRETLVRLCCRAYAALLRVYPRPFQERFADEMRADFEDGLRDALAAGSGGGFWSSMLDDLLVSLFREWRVTMNRKNVLLLASAIAVGLAVGRMDAHSTTDDIQPALLMVLTPTFCCGASSPRHAWRWALAIGAGTPVMHVASVLFAPPTAPVPLNIPALILPFAPAFIGAYLGAGLRRLVSPPPPVHQ